LVVLGIMNKRCMTCTRSGSLKVEIIDNVKYFRCNRCHNIEKVELTDEERIQRSEKIREMCGWKDLAKIKCPKCDCDRVYGYPMTVMMNHRMRYPKETRAITTFMCLLCLYEFTV